jgi:4'-phosphopantetheinyl transferase
MITSVIKTDNWQAGTFSGPDHNTPEILEQPALFIIKSSNFSRDEIHRFWTLLNPSERIKSQRFYRQDDRNNYILVHGMLRSLLSRTLGLPPDSLEFSYNQYGKPYVSGAGTKIFFNMSHSSDVSVIGFDPASEIGVDVEKINENVDYESIISHFFTCNEISYIHSRRNESLRRFFEIWTRKEALLKALGIGITENLGVDVSGSENLKLRNPVLGVKNIVKMHLNTLSLKDNYILSIASGNGYGKIKVSEWKNQPLKK